MGLFKVYVGVQKNNRIFLKGLVNNFVQKIKHFPCFYFGQNRQEKKMCWLYSGQKKSLSWQEKQDFEKEKILRFSIGVGLWLSKIGKENGFGDVLDRKTMKALNLKSQKSCTF